MPWAQGWVALDALVAVLVYLFMGGRVGMARQKHNIQAPAVTGHPEFERLFRVQQNTLENLPPFLVGLYYFSSTVSPLIAGILGTVWILARIVYMQGYVADPAKRGPGAILTFAVTAILVIGGIVGVIMSILRGLPS